jgi:sigma-B regulation protein RsbU (phosphoserine phosphatase)
VASGQFDTALPEIKSRDEIHMLRDSFENMQHSLAKYVEELKSTTAQRATMESELKIAHDIQMSMLPKSYPAFPERNDLDIYGQVMPAKAVGGDLYDFFIRDNKLFFIIGDVSGKGVPASLVMAVTTSLFRNIATYTEEPSHIVFAINQNLTANNDTGMFVTLFVGMLDLTTGKMNYCNAGHNPPLILANGEVKEILGEVNIAAGVIPDFEFLEDHLEMNPGDTIFLYTDGLSEAENIDSQEYGEERVLQVAERTVSKPQTLIEVMTEQVQLFVGEAEQSDDLTMLAIEYTNNL